jgi:hypothetical protein
MQMDGGTAAFTSEMNPASPNRHSEYCLLPEERTAVRKDPQQILVLCNSAPARSLKSVWRMYKRVPARLTDPLLFKILLKCIRYHSALPHSAVYNFP